MNDVLMYFLKVNIAIALFYLFYRLVFYNDTFWSARRFYLVFTIVLSALHPLISLSGWLEKQEPMQVLVANYVQLQEVTISAKSATFWTLENILLVTYSFVSLVLLARMCVQLFSILRWRMKGKKQVLHGIEIVAIDESITPFSFFNTIYLNPALHNEPETNQILAHEKTHAQQRHSLDVLLSELLTIVCWINPAAWLLKREIRHNLEFLADNSVLKSGFDSKNYQYHLLQLTYHTPEVNLVNKFNVSPLKKRITMMNQQKTRKAGLLKYSLIVPLALALVLSSNAETVVNNAKSNSKTTVETPTETKTTEVTVQQTTKSNVKFTPPVIQKQKAETEKIYDVVEKMPQFPGGESELLSYISKSIRYPVVAQESGTQGRIFVRFVVNKDGNVTNASILKSILNGPTANKGVVVVGYARQDSIPAKPNEQAKTALENEVLRIINAMPEWTPGEQNGEKVSVYYTLPVIYKLSD
jgi:hypothetical protein